MIEGAPYRSSVSFELTIPKIIIFGIVNGLNIRMPKHPVLTDTILLLPDAHCNRFF